MDDAIVERLIQNDPTLTFIVIKTNSYNTNYTLSDDDLKHMSTFQALMSFIYAGMPNTIFLKFFKLRELNPPYMRESEPPNEFWKALAHNTTVTCLAVDNMPIMSDSPIDKEFGKCLAVNTTLQSLIINNCLLDETWGVNLANGLLTYSALTFIHMRRSYSGPDGELALMDALATNESVTYLDLTQSMAEIGRNRVGGVLRTNSTLRSLNLTDNELDEEDVIAIGASLRTNSTLTSLRIDINYLEPIGRASIYHALLFNTTLTSLAIDVDWAESDDTRKFCLKHNGSLTAFEADNISFEDTYLSRNQHNTRIKTITFTELLIAKR